MATYLFLWNPKRWRWRWRDLGAAIYAVNNGKPYELAWSAGRSRRPSAGDAFLLMRLGLEPKGIVGFGRIAGDPVPQAHWDESRAEESVLYAPLAFLGLQEEPFIPLEELSDRFPAQTWTPQTNATLVREEYAAQILPSVLTPSGSLSNRAERLLEGAVRKRTVLSYDRNPVARQLCIAEYGWDCAVCGFNFEHAYGPIGRAYVEVHHLLPLAEGGGQRVIDPVRDLRPVCANCHRMLHRGPGVLSIEELRHAHNNSSKPTPLHGAA